MNDYRQPDPQGLTGIQRLAVFVLFFTSRFAGLAYEVLWMKELGLLFGNTAQAYDLILDLSPPESDPYLAKVEPRLKSLSLAGFHLHSSRLYKAEGDRMSHVRSMNVFNKLYIFN